MLELSPEWRGRLIVRKSVMIVLVLLALGALSAGAEPEALEVQYVTADRVYVDGGSRYGLATGDRLRVLRAGEQAALLEVVFVATHSASCRVVESSVELSPGDAVLLEGEPKVTTPVLAAGETNAARTVALVGSQSGSDGSPAQPAKVIRVSTGQEPAAQTPAAQTPAAPPPPVQAPTYTRAEPSQRPLRSSVSGSLTFDWEQFTDGSDFGRDYDRTSARLSVRGRNLGGMPLQLRVRTSTRNLDRVTSSDGSSESETRDRLYELSLAYEPPEGRFALRLGRLRLGRYAGVGTVDGVSGEARFGKVFRLGVFGGSRSDISELGYDGDRTTYGVTTKFTAGEAGRTRELLLAAVREDGKDDVSREYVALQSRVAGGRWSFYQRAELDLNNGWREELSGSSSQLSTLFLNATTRVSERNRLSLSYSRFQRYRTEETRLIPEELFDENSRQGVRARWTIGKSSGLNVTLSGGLREREGDSDDATSTGLAVNHNNLFGRRLSAGLSVLAFSNGLSDGTTVMLRSSKRLKGGHRLSFTAGARTLDDALRGETYETQWFRLGGWFELPGNLFGRAEVEASTGDEIEGQRILIGLGYRL